MRNYDRINALPPKDIGNKSAHIIGGGIAGLAAAAFLVTDASMSPNHVTIYETLPVLGGSMDARAMRRMAIPPEAKENSRPIWSAYGTSAARFLPCRRRTHNPRRNPPGQYQGAYLFALSPDGKARTTLRLYRPLMSRHDAKKMQELLMTPEEKIEMKTAAEWFSPEFTHSVFWNCWSTMLAFRDYHSLIEVKRYVARFLMTIGGLTHLSGILHTELMNSTPSLTIACVAEVAWRSVSGRRDDNGHISL